MHSESADSFDPFILLADWWSTYGGGCPNLTRLAIRILSQTCSTSGCNRDLIPLEHIHDRRRNRLEHQRLYDLIFVQYNLRLQQRYLKRKFNAFFSKKKKETLSSWF